MAGMSLESKQLFLQISSCDGCAELVGLTRMRAHASAREALGMRLAPRARNGSNVSDRHIRHNHPPRPSTARKEN